jgi:drug/metabolite transporter (DMT)-like permease
MPLSALALLFGSAILHTTWNLLVKQAGEKLMATWWGILIGSLLFVPALFLWGWPAPGIWVYILTSALMGASFFFVLPFAYNDSDFSVVYPMARGAAPALIAVWSVLFLREQLSAGGVIGLLIIIAGLMIVGGSGWFAQRAVGISALAVPKPNVKGIWPALLLAVIISIYSVIDGAAVKLTNPVPYAALIYFVSAIYLTPYVFVKHGWGELRQEFRAYRWRLILIGALIVAAYMLALWAYRLSSVSYVGAIREMNVVVGALAGWQLLGEKFGQVRVFGSLVIFAGILVIAIFG